MQKNEKCGDRTIWFSVDEISSMNSNRVQSQEQDIAQRLISEAASRLWTAVNTGDMQTAKVAQIMLVSGNDKLNEAMKQLVDVRACKEKLQAKLMKAQGYT